MPPTPSTDPAREAPAGGLPRAAIAIYAIACGVCVANVYFPQALSPLIAVICTPRRPRRRCW